MRIKDVMNPDVVVVPRDLPLSKVADLFKDRAISGAPVIDKDGAVVGVVSQTDLVLARRAEPSMRGGDLRVSAAEVEAASAASVMTPGAISVDEATSVAEVARLMRERHIHRVLVTRRGRIVGIATSLDLLKAFDGPAKTRRRLSK